MKPFTMISCAAVLAGTAAAQAQSLKGPGFEINPVNAHVYEVVSEGGHGGAAFWCAASLFVEQELKQPMGTEIYVARGAGPSETTDRRSAAQFTIDPAAAGITPAQGSDDLNDLVVGEHMAANEARTFCD